MQLKLAFEYMDRDYIDPFDDGSIQSQLLQMFYEWEKMSASRVKYSFPPSMWDMVFDYHEQKCNHVIYILKNKNVSRKDVEELTRSHVYLKIAGGCDSLQWDCVCPLCACKKKIEEAEYNIRVTLADVCIQSLPDVRERVCNWLGNGAGLYSGWNTRLQYGRPHLIDCHRDDPKYVTLEEVDVISNWLSTWQKDLSKKEFIHPANGLSQYTWEQEMFEIQS